jgi:hypothetical protein
MTLSGLPTASGRQSCTLSLTTAPCHSASVLSHNFTISGGCPSASMAARSRRTRSLIIGCVMYMCACAIIG